MMTSLFSEDNIVQQFVAVKMLKQQTSHASTAMDAAAIAEVAKATEEFYAEIELMKKLRHPHLVTILGVSSTDAAAGEGRPPLLILEHL